MALLLLQALPSPLSARAEPPQVRGRGRPGQAGGLGGRRGLAGGAWRWLRCLAAGGRKSVVAGS